jgi:hypothetical protein
MYLKLIECLVCIGRQSHRVSIEKEKKNQQRDEFEGQAQNMDHGK